MEWSRETIMPTTGVLLEGMMGALLEAPTAPAWEIFLFSGLIGPGGLMVESEDEDAGCGEAGSGDDRKIPWTRGIVPMNQLSER